MISMSHSSAILNLLLVMPDYVLLCTEFLNFDVAQFIYFSLCYAYFCCHIKETIAKSSVMKLLSYLFLQEFFSFRSYI